MESQELDIRLLKLEEDPDRTHFYRWEMMRFEGTPVDVKLMSDFSHHTGSNIIHLSLTARYTTLRSQICRHLLDYTVGADFELHCPGAETTNEEMIVDAHLVRLMFSVALGALRGMLALRTSHTFLANYPLPVYNVDSLMEPIIREAKTIDA
ncbi:MAG: hypothetical protein K2L46_00205 [Paramuribaculum sp.]|nr:hypothetical protein [Paramuribaculum sp.]MDE6487679.1 hypothetical protein [Paramuribaculum sp.]